MTNQIIFHYFKRNKESTENKKRGYYKERVASTICICELKTFLPPQLNIIRVPFLY